MCSAPSGRRLISRAAPGRPGRGRTEPGIYTAPAFCEHSELMEVPVLKVEGLSDPDPAREVIMRLVSVLMFVAAVILSSHPSIAQQPQFPGPQVPPKGAERNGPFSVCIGDSCNGTGDYNNVNAGLNCDFAARSEEHTSELQSLRHLVCR